MKYKLLAYSIWEFGQRKDAKGNPHQEDSIYPAHGKVGPDDRLFILCDGMGGHDAGEVASATVCEAMAASILKSGDAGASFTDEDLNRAVEAAYNALDLCDTGSEKKMGTTLALLMLHKNGATIAHMGDSRVYHIRPGETGKETELWHTEDHSLVNDLVKIGEMTPEEARVSSRKNIITRAMQPHSEPRQKAEINYITDIRPGDYFYLCSDGMLEQPDMEEGASLRNIFSKSGGDNARKVTILKGATDGNSDNHTAFIIEITDVSGAPAKSADVSASAGPNPAKEGLISDPDDGATSDTSGLAGVDNITVVPQPAPAAASGRPTVPPAIKADPTTRHKKKSGFAWIWFIIVALAVCVVLYFALGLFGNGHKKDQADPDKADAVEQPLPDRNIDVQPGNQIEDAEMNEVHSDADKQTRERRHRNREAAGRPAANSASSKREQTHNVNEQAIEAAVEKVDGDVVSSDQQKTKVTNNGTTNDKASKKKEENNRKIKE